MSDVSLAVSETAFAAVFNRTVPTPSIPFDESTSLGPVWFGLDAAFHIEGAGGVNFESTDTFWLDELRIGWDKLVCRLGFDIPTQEIPRFCILRVPDDVPLVGGECLWEFPGGKIFHGAPDIGPLTINLNAIIPFVVTEISGRFKIELVKDTNVVKILAHSESIDVDPISISDTFGKSPTLMQAAIAGGAASYIAANPPAFVLDFVLGELLGFPTLTELLLDLLDIGDDIQEWLTNVLNLNIGVTNLLGGLIAGEVFKKPLFKIPDPYELMPTIEIDVVDYGGFTVPLPTTPTVKIEPPHAAILNPTARFDADMLHITFDLGA